MTVFSFVRRHFTLSNITFVILAALLLSLLFSVFASVRVSGHSMDPTLQDGEWMIGLHLGRNPFVKVSRGDIVIAYAPSLDLLIIKRVVGVPGDVLQLQGGQLYLNGELYHEPYIYEPMANNARNNTPAFKIPEGHYFLMGDNRNNSCDSRVLGLFTADQLKCLVLPYHQAPLIFAFFASAALICNIPCVVSDFLQQRITDHLIRKRNKALLPQSQ